MVRPVGFGRVAELAEWSRLVDVRLEGCPEGCPEGTYTRVCSRIDVGPEVWVAGEEDNAEAVGNGPCFSVEGASDLIFWHVRKSVPSSVSNPSRHGPSVMNSQPYLFTHSYPWLHFFP